MIILNHNVKHEAFSPSSQLLDFVETYFIVSIKKESGISNLEYNVPPRAKAVFLIKKNESTQEIQILIVGPHLTYLKRKILSDEKWCVVVLKPGASMTFFNLPGLILKDNAFNLKQLCPKISNEIENSFTKQFNVKVLDDILKSCSPKLLVNPLIPLAIEMLEEAEPASKISEIAKDLGITIRQLQREFLKWVGVSPKQYQGVARLRTSLNLAFNDPDQNWTQIAAQSGYFDQPHLNNNLGSILALRPTEIRKKSR